MKRSHKKMLIFQGVILLILILNSFVSNILSDYNLVFLLAGSLILFKILFGFEKGRHRYTKDIIYEVIIFLIIFFIAFYLIGLKIGFAKPENYYSFYGFKNFIIPLILTIILKEILRYVMIIKAQGAKILNITTYLIFVMIDVSTAIYYAKFDNGYDTFIFIALTLLPAFINNLVFQYISLKAGYKPIMIYLLVMELYVYLLPIIPNANEYITAIIRFLIPAFVGFRVHSFFSKEKDEEVQRDYKHSNNLPIVINSLLVAVVVYFTSGYFSYYSIVIASGSMSPSINKGDIVVIHKIKENYDKLDVGDVIAYEYHGVIVVHRLINVLKDNETYHFYTKGDNNTNEDNYEVKPEMIIGTVDVRIPYAGYPTVWLSEM